MVVGLSLVGLRCHRHPGPRRVRHPVVQGWWVRLGA